MHEDLLSILKLNIFSRAKIFIEEIGEFAPFGSELIGNNANSVVYYGEPIKMTLLIQQKRSKSLKNNSRKK